MAKRIRIDGSALKSRRESIDGLTQSGLARLAVGRIAAPGPAADRLAISYQVTISNLERGTATLIGPDRLHALATALGCDGRDLTEPVLFGLRDTNGQLVAPGGVAVLTSAREETYRLHGILMGANGSLPARIAGSAPVALWASDRDRWIAEHFDDLDDDERAHVIVVDAPYAFLRALWHLDVAATSPHADERRLAVEDGLVRAMSSSDLAPIGTPEELALDLIEQAHELAARRLSCERLRDQAAPVYDAWRLEEHHLAEAVDRARGLAEAA